MQIYDQLDVDWQDPINSDSEFARGLVGFWLPGSDGCVSGAFGVPGVPNLASYNGTANIFSQSLRGYSYPGGFGSYYFNNSSMSYSNVTLSSGPFTVATWAISDNTDAGYTLSVGAATTNQGVHIGKLNSATWRFGVWGGATADTTTAYAPLRWNMLVGTYDGTNINLYINNRGPISASYSSFGGTNGSGLLNALNNNGARWDGHTGMWAVWNNRAFSKGEVHGFYRESMTGFPTLLNRISFPVAFAEQGGGSTVPVLWHHYNTLRCA